MRFKRKNKYNAKKTEIDGIVFDSRKEAQRYQDLKRELDTGEISDLVLQPEYKIIINDRLVCKVKLDFEYIRKHQLITEDVKGGSATLTPLSRLKHKLVEAQFGIEVRIV